ncbi:MAG: molybdopterin-dependent oxidoreductase [Deltaproteobacteria bacterium]|nr:molybdopterin-dependent oxidoreductase [Deltaproteobacteria bacterium]MBW2070761.1 molybdopterin-dependent oxidoreductase [Deltaproteobacteria bacterium]
MEFSQLTENRARIYQFLSVLYGDEISLDLIKQLKKPEFSEKISAFLDTCTIDDLRNGVERIVRFLGRAEEADVYNMLRYEYADLFLNAGVNPVFPYESVYVSREPVVMQEPIFEVRKAYRAAGVHKSDNYHDLDDHIAVELEFCRYLLEQISQEDEQRGTALQDSQIEFLKNHLMRWAVEFCAVLSSSAQSDFYRGLADLTLSFLFHERRLAFNIQSGTKPEDELVKALNLLGVAVKSLSFPGGYQTLADGAKEPERTKTIPSHCYICGALCGTRVTVKDGIATRISGLPGDPKGGGRLCPKGAAAISHTYSAYRLKEPLIRENGRFRKATWDEALDRVATALKQLEPSTVGYLRGNDWYNWIHEALFDHYGAHKTTHRPMCDNSNRMANEHNLNDKRPWINYENSEYILHFGMNELATSYGQRKTAGLRAAVRRGAKLVVLDPRRSETAAEATEWIQIKPATDAAVAMAMCYVIVTKELYDKDFVENWTYGFEEFKKRLLGEEDGVARSPEWAAKISGVPAETIERIAVEFAHTKYKGALSWTGVAQSPNSMYGTAAVQALNGLLGTFDAPGGPSLPFKRKLKSAWGEGQQKPPANSPPKLNKLGIWQGWAPAFFPKDVAEGRLKALICYFGDPVLSWGNQEKMVEAIKQLEFCAVIDAFMCNTAVLSDVVLPDVTFLEHSQIKADWLYDAFIAYYAKIIDPLFNAKPMWWITVELAKRLGYGEYFPWKDIEEAERNQLAGTPWSYEELKEKGFLITDEAEYYKYKKWGSLNPPEGYGSSGKSKTGKYNFKNPVAEAKGVDPLPDYKEPDADMQPDEKYPFVFGNFRLYAHEHSSTFHNFRLVKSEGTNPLWMNKLDAKQRGLEEGDKVKLRSPWGEVIMEVKPTWFIMQGVLGSAGGFGHWRGPEADPKYPQFGGTNPPGIMKPNSADWVGGTPPLKYIKTTVEKVS